MNWIEIKTKLPEPLFPVLFYHERYGVRLGYRNSGSYKIDTFTQFGSNFRIKKVTHWMPLPEPPKV